MVGLRRQYKSCTLWMGAGCQMGSYLGGIIPGWDHVYFLFALVFPEGKFAESYNLPSGEFYWPE